MGSRVHNLTYVIAWSVVFKGRQGVRAPGWAAELPVTPQQLLIDASPMR
jgi:hypothetical protein